MRFKFWPFKKKFVRCPDCKGTGFYFETPDYNPEYEKTCSRCHGAGVIDATTII